MMADGLTAVEAWPAIPNDAGVHGKNDGGSRNYRDATTKDPSFKERLKTLQDERERFSKDEMYGDVIWMTKQTYRMAVAVRDVSGMQRASAQLKELVMSIPASGGALPAPEAEKGRAGAPSIKGPAQSRDAEMTRKRLLERPRVETPSVVGDDSFGGLELDTA